MTITIIATVKVKEGKMDDAKAALKEIVPKKKASEPGLLEYIPHAVKGRKDKNTIIFYEKYVDKAAMDAHMTSLGKNIAPLQPFLEPGMDLKTCEEIA